MPLQIQRNTGNFVFTNLTSLRALSGENLAEGDLVFLSLSTNPATGSTRYMWDASSTATDDSDLTIKLTDTTTGRLIRCEGLFTPAGTGAVTTKVEAKLQERVSVKDFVGVDFTGVTESTIGIQAAIDATPAGGTLDFGDGTYKMGVVTIAKSIYFKGNPTINLYGVGARFKFTASFDGFKAQDFKFVGDSVIASDHYAFAPASSSIVVSNACFMNIRASGVVNGIDCSAMDGFSVVGGKIGPTVGTSSGQGYGVALGLNSKNGMVHGVHLYRTTRHGVYSGNCIGTTVSGCLFEEHGFGDTPASLSALSVSRSKGVSAVGNTFKNCVHDIAEFSDDDSITDTMEGFTFSGNTIYGCKRPMRIGTQSATVNADLNTIAGTISGNTWSMPLSSDGECIRIYTGESITVSSNTFRFPTETIAITVITIDDLAVDYPTSISIGANNLYANTTNATRALFYCDTAVCGSTSAASVKATGNHLFGNANLLDSATAIQNANIVTDSTEELAITGATPYVSAYNRFALTQGGATNVTDFLGGYDGQRISVRFGDANSTVKNTNIYTSGAVDFVSSTGDQIVYEYDGTNWREISRSLN